MTHTEQELVAFGAWERAAWEQRAGAYAASIDDLTSGSIPALLDAAGVGPGVRVLDVGTGPGFVALAAAARGADVRAVDQSAAMVAHAREAGVDAVQSGVETLSFEDGCFDAVVAGYVLNHLPRPAVGVASLGRVLRPGGRLAMTVWDVNNPALGLFGSVVSSLGLAGVVPPGPDAHLFATDAELRALLVDWDDVQISRPRWTLTVEPGAWFDAVADATPRTGAVLAEAGPALRAQAREAYVELALSSYAVSPAAVPSGALGASSASGAGANGLVALPAGAVLVSARRT